MKRKDFKDYKVFKCYSNKLKWYILDNSEEKYVDIGTDDKGKYWLFIRTEKLHEMLDTYVPVAKRQG